MTTSDQTHVPASPRQGDKVLDPTVAQGDWTAETQELREPEREVQPSEIQPEPVAQPESVAQPAPSTDSALIAEDQLTGLRARWDHVQASFVDDPRECVHKADGLVTDVVEHLTSSFANARTHLEEQWARGEDASTEDLRVALTRYRDFFERLLAV
jgi:hypothetical protein